MGSTSTSAEPTATAVSVRPQGRSGIDSTGSGTAQISAALTIYLSKLGGPDEAGPSADPTSKPSSAPGARGVQAVRSGAADALRALDAFHGGGQRLTA